MANLRDRYCIVGVGETEFSRNSGRTTRALGAEAVKKAILDAGLTPKDVDGMLSYNGADSSTSPSLATDLGIHLNFYMDCWGGGSSTEALIGLAMGAIEVGMCHTVAIWRAMNGYSEYRVGGTGRQRVGFAPGLLTRSYGLSTPAQMYSLAYVRHMMEFGITNEQLATITAVQSRHASNNPKALYKKQVTAEEVLNSRWITKPVCHLLDCCVESDNGTCLIVTSAERAKDLRQRPIYIMGVVGRVCQPRGAEMSYQHFPVLSRVAGHYAAPRVYAMAGIGPEDVDVTGLYDCFTYTVLMQAEAYGFCGRGEGGEYVTSGIIELGGKRPSNTSGGQLRECYNHGMNLVVENVRQLRGQADDYCPRCQEGIHSYDYSEGKCRQAKDAEIALNTGWPYPAVASALILRR